MVGNKDMYCQNKIVHTIQAGDSLYKLSRQYHTTVTELILGNPGVNPYNLQIGMQLFICPGEGYVPPQNPGGGNTGGGTGNAGSGTGNTGSGNMSGGTGSMGGNMGGGTGNAGGSNETESEREDSILRLNEDMRLAWLNHVYWTRRMISGAREHFSSTTLPFASTSFFGLNILSYNPITLPPFSPESFLRKLCLTRPVSHSRKVRHRRSFRHGFR